MEFSEFADFSIGEDVSDHSSLILVIGTPLEDTEAHRLQNARSCRNIESKKNYFKVNTFYMITI